MNKFRNTPNIHDYLEQAGVLVNGDEEQIKAAKKIYRKKYLLEYKRWQRKNKPEFTIQFSMEYGEYPKIQIAAAEHKMKIPGFIKAVVFAYLSKTYLTPNREEIVRLEQNLAQIANEIRSLCSRKALWANPEERYQRIEKQVERLNQELSNALRNPQTVEEMVTAAINQNPVLRESLLAILTSNDNQNQITQKTELSPTS